MSPEEFGALAAKELKPTLDAAGLVPAGDGFDVWNAGDKIAIGIAAERQADGKSQGVRKWFLPDAMTEDGAKAFAAKAADKITTWFRDHPVTEAKA